MKTFLILLVAIFCITVEARLYEKFAWRTLDYNWRSPADRENALRDKTYTPQTNVPVGVERWRNKVFVTITR